MNSRPAAANRCYAALLALAAGVAGGSIANYFALPLAWMLGALLANVLLVIVGASPALPSVVRRLALPIIGTYLGASATTAVVADIAHLMSSLLWLLLYVVVVMAFARAAFLRLLPINRRTALCAAIPGAFSLTLALAEKKGDEPTVMMIQILRLVMIILSLPFLARFFLPAPVAAEATAVAVENAGLLPVLLLALPVAAVGLFFNLRTATILVLALALSAAAHIGGVVSAPLPPAPIDIALFLLGTSVGCSFVVFRQRPLRAILIVGFAINGAMIAAAALFAAVGAPLLEVSFWALLLALAPGAISEISLIALTLGIAPTYVVLHQVLRIVGLVLFLPPLLAYWERRKQQ